jgi:tetratricopeptide (TPR) repeat protein
VTRAAPFVEAGIRAFMRGDRGEAERCWREALRRDPADDRAREYLSKLTGGPRAVPAPTPPPRAVPPAAAAPPDEAAAPVAATPRAAAPGPASAWDEEPSANAQIALSAHGGLDLEHLRHDGLAAPLAFAPTEPAPARGHQDGASDLAVWMRSARELFALGDFSGSLELVEKILAVDATNREALRYLEENEATLVAMYESKLGPLHGVPRVAVRPEEVLWLNLDHRAGFVLSQIDGTITWDDLFALSGMPRLDTARILARLIEDGVVRPD